MTFLSVLPKSGVPLNAFRLNSLPKRFPICLQRGSVKQCTSLSPGVPVLLPPFPWSYKHCPVEIGSEHYGIQSKPFGPRFIRCPENQQVVTFEVPVHQLQGNTRKSAFLSVRNDLFLTRFVLADRSHSHGRVDGFRTTQWEGTVPPTTPHTHTP